MNDAPLYQGYDRAALDVQYDNRRRVPEHVESHDAWTADGDAVLAEFAHRLDVPFGPGAEETLDIYMPGGADGGPGGPGGRAGAPAGAPVNVFIHGGYWMSRHKDDFRFIARGIVPRGGISVVVNYALVPSVDLDELIRQCRAAVAWTYENAADFGADPDRIFVSGHSAGGHLTAMMLATDWPAFKPGLPADVVKGGAALSGIYDLTPIRMCYLDDTLGFTEDQVARNSPITLRPATGAPVIVAVGADESEEFLRQGNAFAAAWAALGVACREMVIPGRNHFTILDDTADPESGLGRAIAAQMGLA